MFPREEYSGLRTLNKYALMLQMSFFNNQNRSPNCNDYIITPIKQTCYVMIPQTINVLNSCLI